MKIVMIPARMGSQRLKRKNLRKLAGVPLISRCIRKCLSAAVFDEVWVNSEHIDFKAIAELEGAKFHQRPKELGDNNATSEDFVAEFLNEHQCDMLFQVHSIAPLLTTEDIRSFVKVMESDKPDCLLSAEDIQIECMYEGGPVNFTLNEKTNSQDLTPVRRISWSITGWQRESFLSAFKSGKCATYSGKVQCHPISQLASLVIKTEDDLQRAEALFPFINPPE